MLPFGGDIPDTIGFLDTLAKCNALMAVEGQNEANNQPYHYGTLACDPDGHLGGARVRMVAVHFSATFTPPKADPNLVVPFLLLAPTEMGDQNPDNAGLQFLSIPTGSGLEFPDGTVHADVANIHPYDNPVSNPPPDNDVVGDGCTCRTRRLALFRRIARGVHEPDLAQRLSGLIRSRRTRAVTSFSMQTATRSERTSRTWRPRVVNQPTRSARAYKARSTRVVVLDAVCVARVTGSFTRWARRATVSVGVRRQFQP